MSGAPRTGPWTVLMVCTGNLCRSPMAQHLAAAHFPANPPDPASRLLIHSAGIAAQPDDPMHPHAAALLHARGFDPAEFRARPLTADLVEASDLVLTATREHRSEVVGLAPRALRRTFTMREFSRLTSGVRGGDLPTGQLRLVGEALAAEAWRARGAGRMVPAALDDLSDPVGQSRDKFEACATMIDDALAGPLSLLARACQAWRAVPAPRRPTSARAARPDLERLAQVGLRASALPGGVEPAQG
ncbi:protein-tyrosine-phosphatase [Frankia sp. AgB32]|uniref:arsenate reductase/protein-tyrosine-phosphatase family protein n=1 Tax=Frankia sp. AgB32 TaxID=631119 RepID=UPI00200E5CD5|nr:protein-tyrosine-phosphatase [Frankia sp. AgB32]MCK9896574.1 protein-tyrosine-phosphatase [Frankia sp. AgB32]